MADILDGFDELTDEIQAEQAQRLAAAGVIARERDPDQYARANALADKRGLPVDVVADHLADFEAQDEDEDVRRADLPFEYMLNALRLREGFALQDFVERTGLPLTAIAKALGEAERKGLITRDMARVRPTERGFDFLNDLQALFLAD